VQVASPFVGTLKPWRFAYLCLTVDGRVIFGVSVDDLVVWSFAVLR